MDSASNSATIVKEEVASLLLRYAAAIDARDASAFRSCFTDRVTVDNAGNPRRETTGDEWTDQAMRAVGAFDRTAHRLSNIEANLDDQDVRCTADVEARHWNADVELVVWARYSHRLVRCDDGWRIQHFAMQVIETKAEPIRS